MSFSTSLSFAKLETSLLQCSSSSSWAPSATNLSVVGRTFIQRGVIRCDASAPDALANASTLSALNHLNTSSPADRYKNGRSNIVVIGLTVHTAPVEMREKLAIPEAELPNAIAELCSLNHIEEAAILSTCNRLEIYVIAMSLHPGVKEVMGWMSQTSSIPISELRQHRFILHNSDATRHLFEVSSGLDSLVLGEGQILAQVKQVVKLGEGVNGFGRHIGALFKHAIAVGKRVRTETNIAAGAVSLSSAAVELAFMKLTQVSHHHARILVIGAGKMGKLVIKHLAAKGCTNMVVVNRTEERVAQIRQELKDVVEIIYKPLSELMTCAGEADVVFTSTSSETPLFLKDDVHNLPPAIGGHRLFIDISVPRNVESCVSDIDSVRVYNVDDLKEVVAANNEDRLRKAMEAQAIIVEELKQFQAWRDSLETVPTIKKLRAYAERIRLAELEKCFGKLGGGDEISKKTLRAVDDLSRGIVNKLLHGPMQHLRYGGNGSRTLSETLENMHALNRMFGLD